MSRYAYASGNPFTGSDPDGRCAVDSSNYYACGNSMAQLVALNKPVINTTKCHPSNSSEAEHCARTGSMTNTREDDAAWGQAVRANRIEIAARAKADAAAKAQRETEAKAKAESQAKAAAAAKAKQSCGPFGFCISISIDPGALISTVASVGAGLAVGLATGVLAATGADVLIVAAGAIGGAVGAAAGDLAAGRGVNIQSIAAGAVAGGTYAAVFLATGSPSVAGAASGAAADLTIQGWNYIACPAIDYE